MTDGDEPAPSRSVLTRADWDEAVVAGTLTPRDAVARLHRIAVHEFGREGAAGYDADGFVVSLTAEGLRLEGGVTLVINPHDHPPPHVHVKRPGETDIRINLETGDVLGALPRGVRSPQLRTFVAAVSESFDVLGRWWEKNHGTPVTKSRDWP